MKIAAILENPIHVGGGFNQALNAVQQLRRMAGAVHEVVVFTTIAANLDYLNQLGIAALPLGAARGGIAGRLLAKVRRVADRTIWRGRPGSVEATLLAERVDLAYFLTHSSTPNFFRRLNYVTTVLDLCHRDNLEFPEVGANGEFEARELHFGHCLPRAFAIVAASESLAQRIVQRYGVDRERIFPMPFEPSPFLADQHARGTEDVLQRVGLERGYYFYPAQFWPHKNHVRILEALALLNQRGVQRRLAVFSGGDHGNRPHLERVARELGVHEQARFLGFVPAEDMRALYEGCAAVVMPTYFGPTNIPPLEAWLLRKPIVYSSHLSEHTGDAAILVDPDDAVALAGGMQQALETTVAEALTRRGQAQLARLAVEREASEAALLAQFARFAERRKCWA